MLKMLTDDFYRLSTEAEELLQRAITELHEEHVPSAEETLRISTTLAGLQDAYSKVRMYASEKIADEDMPEENAPVRAYVAIINNKRLITEGILKDFLRAYTDNERYEDVLRDAQENATRLLCIFQEDMSSELDVTPYKAFVDGIRMGPERLLNSDEGDDIIDAVEILGKKLSRGLQGGYFVLHTELSAGNESEEVKPCPVEKEETTIQKPESNSAEDAQLEEKQSGEATSEIKAEPEISVAIDGGALCAVDDNIDDPAAADSDKDYIFAREHKMNSSLPSSKKLKEAFNSIMGALLLDTIGTIHLISDKLFIARAYPRTENLDWSSWLNSMEKKGYLSAYEVDDETYYCVSQMLCGCLNKLERSKDLLEILNRFLYPSFAERNKRFRSPIIKGEEKIERNTLLKHISWLKTGISILKGDMPVHFEWDSVEKAYLVSGVESAKNSIFADVFYVTPDEYASWITKEERSVCSYGDTLPEWGTMKNTVAKNCFYFTDRMYHWDSNEWKVFEWRVSREKKEEKDVAVEQIGDTEDVHEPEVMHEQSVAVESEVETPIEEHKEPLSSTADITGEDGGITGVENKDVPESEPVAVPVQLVQDDAKEAAEIEVPMAMPIPQTKAKRDNKDSLVAMIRSTGSADRRDYYLKLAYAAYAEGRRGVGSVMMRALAQMHPDVYAEWLKWACATADPAYTGGRNATRLQEIYPDANYSDLANSALAVSSYIRMYFSNDAAKEYWVKSTDAVASTSVLKQMSSLRELMQRLQNYVDANQHGINEATLLTMRKESGIEDKFTGLKSKANDLLKARLTETTVSNPRVKNLFELLFDNNSLIIDALQCICEDKKGDAVRISEALEAIDPDLLKNSQTAIESWIEDLWDNSTKKMKGKGANDPIKGSGRNSAVNRTKNALGVINEWIELCIHNAEFSEQNIIAAAAEVKHLAKLIAVAIADINAYKTVLRDDVAGYGALSILEDTLKYFAALMNGESLADVSLMFNAEVSAYEAMAVEEDGTVYIIPVEDMVVPYEQCDILANIVKEASVSAEDAALRFVTKSMTNIDENGGNFGNGRYLLNCVAKMYQPSLFAEYSDAEYAEKTKAAAAIVAIEDRKFHAHMEMAQGYGWFTSYDEQERIERAVAAQCEMYKIINNFSACVECMKRTYDWCRQTARSINHDRLMAELNEVVKGYGAEESNATIVRIRKLIEQDCYTAATAEIRKINKDNGLVIEDSTAISESEFSFFVQNFQAYYTAVRDVNSGMEKVFANRNRHVHKGYVSTGTEMMRAWPQSPEAVNPYNIKRFLNPLLYQMSILDVTQIGTPNEGHVVVKLEAQEKIEHTHPIADFGTRIIADGLDIFFLGGNKEARSYFDMIRTVIGKATGHAAVFLVNSAMTLSARRQLVSMIWHELRSTVPVLVLDRALALYVAEHSKEQRWNVMLQCAIPFAMVKPYTENSSAQQPPEMFVGRVEELRRLKTFDQDGCILVYGGRQLGKSAILYRVEQEVHKPKESIYAVYCSIKDMNAAEAVRHIVLSMRRKNVPDVEHISLEASWADMCFGINVILTEHPELKLMLLIDESDILLGKDKETNYSALSAIKRVQDALGNRFKYVFAGLHNVMRLHHNEALANNSDMPKMGFINIKPLDYAEAETLLKKPLSYMGFMFNESEEQQALISMILSTTNYYPGLIHYYCASLLNTFGDGHTEPAPTKPPHELDNKLILKLLQKKEFMEQTKQKFMMTLGIDKDEHQYYSILAYLMAYCYDENESQVNGVSVDEICEAAEMTDISVISKLESTQVETLLDELCELNILYSAHGFVPKRYVFSRPAFKDMLGTQDDVMEALLNYIGVEEVSQ